MKPKSEKIANLIALLPSKPGVYLMKDEDDRIIYIGKAKDLKKRVSQYFLREQSGKVAAMVSHVDHFDFIIVHTDKEAFILEMNLIKEHLPRYNIMLMDDSHYPYIAVDRSDGHLSLARNAKNKRFLYFGPFPSSKDAYRTIDLLNSLYPTRKCAKMPKRPCLYLEMGNCLGPCIKKIEESETSALFERIRRFLNGDIDDASRFLKEKIDKASEEERYEDAKFYYDTLKAIEATVSKQSVEHNEDKISRDVFAYALREGYLSLAVLTYRNGILLGKKTLIVEAFGDNNEQISELIEQYYENNDIPKEIAINLAGFDEEFSSVYPEIKIVHPKEGRLLEQIDLAALNAKMGIDAHFSSARLEDDNIALLEELGELLHIKTPYRIELFDNSHLEGSNAVGAEVCFINGAPAKKMYRKFKLNPENAGDDYHSMKEVIYRRYKRIKEEGGSFPDLLLVDGGIAQIKAAKEAFGEAGVDMPLFGLYKNDKHETKGIIGEDEKIYPLPKSSPLFFLLMRMQDEVHRFAISFHRELRSKAMTKSIFDDIKGIGEKRKELLRKHYPTLESLEKSSVEELSQIIPIEAAEALLAKTKEGKKE